MDCLNNNLNEMIQSVKLKEEQNNLDKRFEKLKKSI